MRQLLLILFLTFSAFGNIIYVSPTGSTSGDGSEASPYDSVQRGINESIDGDTVLLEDGTYHEHNLHLFSKKIVLGSRFVLDADTNHVDNCVIDGDSITNTSYGSVFQIENMCDTTTKLIGFTITRGTGTKTSINGATASAGAGIYFEDINFGLYMYRIKICRNRCAVYDYSSGGGIFRGSSYLKNCLISDNSSRLYGGGIIWGRNVLINCVFSNNTAHSKGGGVYQGENVFVNCIIKDNISFQGAGFYGGINKLIDCQIINNEFYEGNDSLINCEIKSNSEYVFSRGTHYLINCVLHDNNTTVFWGGRNNLFQCELSNNYGIFITDLSNFGINLFRNCLIYNNKSGFYQGENTFINCTFANFWPGGPFSPTFAIKNSEKTNITNCIILDTIVDCNNLIISYSIVEYLKSCAIDAEAIYLQNVNPLFVDSTNRNYRLLQNSPGVDLGHPDSSFINEPYCDGHNHRINVGYYGNTNEAACRTSYAHMQFIPQSFINRAFVNEIIFDTIVTVNEGDFPLIVFDRENIYTNDTNLVCNGLSQTHTVIESLDSCNIYLKYVSNYTTNDSISIQINFLADNSGDTVDYLINIVNKTYDDLFDNIWEIKSQVGLTAIKGFYLINYGYNAITIDSIKQFSPYFQLSGTTTNFTIMPGDSHAVTLSFLPQTAQQYQSRVYLYSPNINCTDSTLIISGTGVFSSITISPDTLDFGSVLKDESKTLSLTIKNENPIQITISNISSSSSDFTVSGSTNFTLQPDEQVTREILFSPITTGEKSGTLTITNTSMETPEYTVYLSGKGVMPLLTLSSQALHYGEVYAGSYTDDTLFIKNSGDGELRIDSIKSDHNWFQIQGNTGSQTVNPADSVMLTMRFQPADASDALSQNVFIYSSDSNSPHEITVTGTGIKSDVSANINQCDFGTVHLLGSRDTVITITNSGNASVDVIDIVFDNAGFSKVSDMTSIGANSSAPLSIRFAPQEPEGGVYAGSMKLYYESTFLEILLSGKATGRPFCSITEITPASVPWETTADISFRAAAGDSDVVGSGTPVSSYMWSSSLIGGLNKNSDNFSMKASELGIGKHIVTLRVVDNEGDTSNISTDSVTITNRLPFAEIISISPLGLIIKGGGDVTLTGRGHDLDEYATETNDSLKIFKWYSSIQGFLGDGKTITVNSNNLDIGLHSFYIQVVDDEGDTATSALKSIPVQSDIGRVLMVAGTGFDDYYYFFSNITPNCNWAYKMAKDRGFTDDHIYYMNPVGWQSLDDPYTNSHIVDNTTMTLASLRNYLLSTDVINDVKNDVPLIIYLLGHGSQTQMNGKFYLNKTEVLTADTLAAWLDSYGDLASGNSQIVVILDFCYSGQFQQRLRTALAQNRFVITSSDPTHAAYFSRGRCFAWTIWRDVHRGENLSTGYSHALDWSNLNAPGGNTANPMLNCNSDGQYNTAADYVLADNVYIGGNHQLQDITSFVDSLTYSVSIITKELTLTAHVRGDFTKLWCRVFTPDFDYTSGSIEQLPLFELDKVDAATYIGNYAGPWVLGNYMLKVDGTDENGNLVMGNAVSYNNDMVNIEEYDTTKTEEKDVSIFIAVPNPADENSPCIDFYFISQFTGDAELRVYDAVGNVVYNNSCQVDDKKKSVGTWDLKNRFNKRVTGGTYLAVLRFTDNDGKVNLYKTKVGIKK